MLVVERVSGSEIAEPPSVGGGVSGADLEDRTTLENHPHHVMGVHLRVAYAKQWHSDDSTIVDAKHPVPGLQ
jgi:hypothetical protein